MPEQHFTAEELSTEEWRPVVDFEDYYHVSSIGRVKRVKPYPGRPLGYCLRITLDENGYPFVSLCVEGAQHQRWIHRLVAAAFIGPCPDRYQVNHMDGNKLNAKTTNLEYLTKRENHKHAQRNGLLKHGPAKLWVKKGRQRKGPRTNPVTTNASLTLEQAREVRRLVAQGVRPVRIAEMFKTSACTIFRIRSGTAKCYLEPDA